MPIKKVTSFPKSHPILTPHMMPTFTIGTSHITVHSQR